MCIFFLLQTEIAKRLNAIIAQILPFLSQEHQQQVATAVERAKQVTMTELNAIIGVSIFFLVFLPDIRRGVCYRALYSLDGAPFSTEHTLIFSGDPSVSGIRALLVL